jgi:hypothetical protein
MEEVIWVEVLSRHRAVTARHRCRGPEIRIGRGYDNDVVIDDPHVAAQHLRVTRDEAGALFAEDIGSANGLFADRGTDRLERIALDGDRIIRVGHTYLRVRDAGYAVPREQTYGAPSQTWLIALTLAGFILGAAALSRWLDEVVESKFSTYLYLLLGICGLALGWTAMWAILSRIFAGHARFDRHLLIALAGLFVFYLYDWSAQFAAFSLSWSVPAAYLYIAAWCLFAGVCFLHLREVGRSHLALKGGITVVLLVVATATQTLMQSEARAEFGQQSYMHRLLPPTLRLTRLQRESDFFAEIERLKIGLDRDRATAQPAGAANTEDDR